MARVLVVDDCPFNIHALQSLLEQFELASDSACNGIEAMRRFEKRLREGNTFYELILMDYSMPICDGLQTTQRIRSLMNEI